MQTDVPKQYLKLNNKPILQHTLERLFSLSELSGLLIGLAKDDPYWPELEPAIAAWPNFLGSYIGGKERADTVLNGLNVLSRHKAKDDDWVMVHDAARPCVRTKDIQRLIQEIRDHPVGGLLGLPVADTVKRTDNAGNIIETVDRTGLWRALTPQVFRLGALQQALMDAQDRGIVINDEASAIEATGKSPLMVAGHADNIKITVPEDLQLAAGYLQQQEA